MTSDLYQKTKKEIHNLQKINFSENEWKWYYDKAVLKRLNELDKNSPAEKQLIKAALHSKRANNIREQYMDKMEQLKIDSENL